MVSNYKKKYSNAEIISSDIPEYRIKVSDNWIKFNPARVKSSPPILITDTKNNFFIFTIISLY